MVLTQGDPVTPCEAYIPLYLESYIISIYCTHCRRMSRVKLIFCFSDDFLYYWGQLGKWRNGADKGQEVKVQENMSAAKACWLRLADSLKASWEL